MAPGGRIMGRPAPHTDVARAKNAARMGYNISVMAVCYVCGGPLAGRMAQAVSVGAAASGCVRSRGPNGGEASYRGGRAGEVALACGMSDGAFEPRSCAGELMERMAGGLDPKTGEPTPMREGE